MRKVLLALVLHRYVLSVCPLLFCFFSTALLPFIILLAVGCLFIRKFLPIPMEKHLSFHYPAAPATPVNEDDMTLVSCHLHYIIGASVGYAICR